MMILYVAIHMQKGEDVWKKWEKNLAIVMCECVAVCLCVCIKEEEEERKM